MQLNTDESTERKRQIVSGVRGKGYCKTAALAPKRTGTKVIRADQGKAG